MDFNKERSHVPSAKTETDYLGKSTVVYQNIIKINENISSSRYAVNGTPVVLCNHMISQTFLILCVFFISNTAKGCLNCYQGSIYQPTVY
jgi:hypothetical protein